MAKTISMFQNPRDEAAFKFVLNKLLNDIEGADEQIRWHKVFLLLTRVSHLKGIEAIVDMAGAMQAGYKNDVIHDINNITQGKPMFVPRTANWGKEFDEHFV